ncbi:hypothetical protein HDE_05647 [Halotydeus destructor]|nr:hypothetical protein HDE_05647 [Halotydeus destructor]
MYFFHSLTLCLCILVAAYASPAPSVAKATNVTSDDAQLGIVGSNYFSPTSCGMDPCKEWNKVTKCCEEKCLEPMHCFFGDCVSCTCDDHCDGGKLCIDGECQSCLFNSHCLPNHRCVNTQCQPVCQFWQIEADGRCVDRCHPYVWHNDQCVQCKKHGDCKNGLKCIQNECVQCGVNGDCGPDQQCNKGQCQPSCDSCHTWNGQQCTSKCAPLACVGGECVKCSRDSECKHNFKCVGGECVPCRVTTDCKMGQQCVDYQCQPSCPSSCQLFDNKDGCVDKCHPLHCLAGKCVQCREDTDCSGCTPKCSNNVCKACRVNSDCGRGQDCNSCGQCVPACNDPCHRYDPVHGCVEKCYPLSCDNGRCVACKRSEDCRTGLQCVGGKCEIPTPSCSACEKYEPGKGCVTNCANEHHVCRNGRCEEYKCKSHSDCAIWPFLCCKNCKCEKEAKHCIGIDLHGKHKQWDHSFHDWLHHWLP